MRKRVLFGCAVVAAFLTTAAGARPLATPGVTSSEIHLGSSVPLSGEAAAGGNVARGSDAYFKYVNAQGGVLGRKIKFTYLDDGYDPARAVNNAIRLVQQEQVFALFSTLGTNNNLAIRKFLNQQGVPQLFVSAGATTFGRDYTQYPWTIGYIPPYSEEGKLYGKYILGHLKRFKIAVLYQNDDYGRDLLAGLRKGLGAKASSIAAKVGYDPTSTDVQPQIAQLKASKANVLCIFAFGKFSLQAYNGLNRINWHPQVFVNDVSSASALMIAVPQKAADGSISIVFGKDPATPIYANDKGVKLFQTIWRKYGTDVKRIDRRRHGGGLHDGGHAQEGGQEPDAPGRDAGGDAPEREGQPVPGAGDRRPDDAVVSLPGDAGQAAALEQQSLAPVRGPRLSEARVGQSGSTQTRMETDEPAKPARPLCGAAESAP
ncbi:MAG: branched-chain amino acid ABC transporter substrate-binding protein [Actinobacteria bacterium]|nr:MAG: branched-chain amino acid ABC transporter substrate-binding protein [Actinomycetota bacterium]